MTPPSALLSTLKTRYGFADWTRASRAREEVFNWNYRMQGGELPGRQLARQRAIPLRNGARFKSSLWQGAGTGLVWLDLAEHRSREQAHEAMIELIGEFSRPIALESRLGEIGDVCLWTPDGSWFGFSRGNVVVRVTQQQTAALARSVARQFDAALISRPAGARKRRAVQPLEWSPPGSDPRPRELVGVLPDFDTETDPASPEARSIRVFIRGGTVVFESGCVIVPEAPQVEIETFVASPGAPAISSRFRAEAPR